MIGSHLPRVLAGARRWTSSVLPSVSLTVLVLLLGFSGQALALSPSTERVSAAIPESGCAQPPPCKVDQGCDSVADIPRHLGATNLSQPSPI